MKFTIRRKVWETNSSSIHSLSISEKGLQTCKLNPEEDGYIHIRMKYFGKELNYYSSQRDKLCYLLVCCCYFVGCDYGEYDTERLYEDCHFQKIQKAVMHYIEKERHDILGIKVDHMEDAELDHQSVPEDGEFPIPVNIWDEKSIQNFIFNGYISLKTDTD